MKIILYTLPMCGICNMIKTKLQQKNIIFEEKNFEDIAEAINSNRAPALEITNAYGDVTIYNTPSDIVSWIENQKGVK